MIEMEKDSMEQLVVSHGRYLATYPLPNRQEIILEEPRDEFVYLELDAEEIERLEPFE